MSQKKVKHRLTLKDHLIAYLVVVLIICVVIGGGAVLYASGIFTPVEIQPALADVQPLQILPTPEPTATPEPGEEGAADTQAPSAGASALLDWLIPRAIAEEAAGDAAETPQPTDTATEPPAASATATPIILNSEDDLAKLLQEIVAEEEVEEEITDAQRVSVDRGDLAINENLPEGIYNVLLLATDSRDMTAKTGRSDVMIVASLDMAANEIKLSSLSRDLWVALPNGVGSNKLNAAYAFGGANLAMKAVNELFELNIEDYVVVNFAMMSSIVDSLGGVDIYLEGMEYAYINYNVAVSEDYEGFAKSAARKQLSENDVDTVVHLDGLQAVSYARIRKLDNDFQRGSRQRILLQAMMDKGLSNLSVATFYSLATSMLNSVSTNVKLTTVIEIGTWLLGLTDFPSMSEMSIPIAGTYHSDTEKDMSVVKFNHAQNVQGLHTFIYGEYIPAGEAQ